MHRLRTWLVVAFAPSLWSAPVAHHAGFDGDYQTERNETKQNETEWNGMKQHCATLPFHIVRSLVERNDIVLNDIGNFFFTHTVYLSGNECYVRLGWLAPAQL